MATRSPIAGILALVLIALSTDAMAESAAPASPPDEDGWHVDAERKRRFYAEAGALMGGLVGTESAQGEDLSTFTAGAAFVVGFWATTYFALEAHVDLGVASHEFDIDDGRDSTVMMPRVGARLRFGLPIRVTPVAAFGVGYGVVIEDWERESGSGADFAIEEGTTHAHGLWLSAEAGAQINSGVFTSSLVFSYGKAVRGRIEGSSGSGHLLGSASVATQLQVIGGQLRAGVRF